MSKLFEKSRSDLYKKYFLNVSELASRTAQFSLRAEKIITNSDQFKPWEIQHAGIPMAWDSEKSNVHVDYSDNHTLVIGPTGSKKSRLVVMPLVRILCSEEESMIISDPKAEVYNRTAKYLKDRNYEIFVLNLRAPEYGDSWNPLAIPYEFYIRGDVDKACEFVNDIAENLIGEDKHSNDPFWGNSAGAFFFGLVLLLFKYCQDFNKGEEFVHIGNIIRLRNMLFSGMSGKTNATLWDYAKNDPIIASSLIGTVETASETRAGILSTFDQKVRMFAVQPNLLDMLGKNSIDLSMIGSKPCAIYLIVPDEKTGYHGLVSLFIKQSYEYMIHSAQNNMGQNGLSVARLRNRVNYVLDEFSSLPAIRDFPAMVTAARSRNIRFTLVIQSKHQLVQRYKEEAETIQTNCNNWVFLTSRELRLLEEISSLCGNTVGDKVQPVIPISLLQRMDKHTGEALLLCDRAKPCITKLADISEYDHDRFEVLEVAKRKEAKISILVHPLLKQEREERSPYMNIGMIEHPSLMQTRESRDFFADFSNFMASKPPKIMEMEFDEKAEECNESSERSVEE